MHRILDFTLSNCVNSNLRKIYVLTQYQREPLHDYVRQNRLRLSGRFQWSEGHQLECVPPVTGKRYRGTADAVFQNLALVREELGDYVLITCGDHIYTMDYRKLLSRHAASGSIMTIATVRRPVGEASAFGVVDAADDGTIIGFREKPPTAALPPDGDVLVNMGVYVFNRRALLDIADNAHPLETDFGQHIIPKLIGASKVSAYDFDRDGQSYWRDVGSLDSYYRASMDLVGSNPVFDPESNPGWPIHALSDGSLVRSGLSRIAAQAITGRSRIRYSVISSGARVEEGALVHNSVVLPGAYIASGARIRNAIVTEGAIVPGGYRIGENIDEDQNRFLVTTGGVVVVNNLLHQNAREFSTKQGMPALPAA
jgi:glucose-1-phosphate adenylyltransferase